MKEKDLKKLFEDKLGEANFEFNPSNWDAFEQMADPQEPLSEQEFKKLFQDKLPEASFAFNPANWEAFEQMTDPQQPLSEQEYKKLFRDKMAKVHFPFNPANWEALEDELGPEQGMSGAEMQDLFQKKASDSSFAFNPDNWARMEAILDQRDRRPLAYFWRSAAAILLLASLAVAALWQQPKGAIIYSPQQPIAADEVAEPQSIKSTQPSEINPTKEEGSISNPALADEAAIASNSANGGNSGAQPPVQNFANASESTDAVPVLPAVQSNFSAIAAESVAAQSLGINNLAPAELPLSSDLMFVDLNPNLGSPSVEKEPYIPQAYSRIYAVAGPALSAPLNGKMGSPGWQAGIEYEYGWNDRVSISTGAIYNRSGDIGLETLHDSTFFGLGRTEVETHRHYKYLSSIRIPLAFNYNIAPKHRFGLGLNTDVLLTVSMDETKTTRVFKQDPRVEETSYNKKMDSFEPLNFSASISYQYQYSPRLSMAFTYAFALNDISRDNAQNFEADHRPGQANLQLRYRLFEE